VRPDGSGRPACTSVAGAANLGSRRPRTGLCLFSNRSLGVENGNWKNKTRDWRRKPCRFGNRSRSLSAARRDAVADPMHARNEPDSNLADLRYLSRSQLRDLWQKEVGEKPPGSFGREVLALGIAYVRQERWYGGLRKAGCTHRVRWRLFRSARTYVAQSRGAAGERRQARR